jgi:hypothetical protein
MNNPEHSRRKFFNSLAGKIVAFTYEINGIPQMKLNGLNDLPDKVIEQMIPVMVPDDTFRIESDHILIYNKNTELFEKFKQLSRHQMYILRSFDGISTIRDITLKYASKYKVENETAFRHVRSLFTSLAEYMVCHPKDAHAGQQ